MIFSPSRVTLSTICRKFSTDGKKLIDVVVNDGIASVILQNPPVNALNLELFTELSDALGHLEDNKSRGVILRSSVEKLFSAGFDFNEMYKPKEDRVKKFWTTFQDVWIKLYGHSAPTVACLHGFTPAGACILALGCEYRVMVKNGSIGLNETRMGYSAPPWFIGAMEDVIGRRRSEIALTAGIMFTAEEALEIGLVDEIAEDKDDALVKSVAFCNIFKDIPSAARVTTKRLIRKKRLDEFIKNREKDFEDCFKDALAAEEDVENFINSTRKK